MNARTIERTETTETENTGVRIRLSTALRPVTLQHVQCKDPGHRPPPMRVYQSGHYDHECPKCGPISAFMIKNAEW